jgi:hypothetical protein
LAISEAKAQDAMVCEKGVNLVELQKAFKYYQIDKVPEVIKVQNELFLSVQAAKQARQTPRQAKSD